MEWISHLMVRTPLACQTDALVRLAQEVSEQWALPPDVRKASGLPVSSALDLGSAQALMRIMSSLTVGLSTLALPLVDQIKVIVFENRSCRRKFFARP